TTPTDRIRASTGSHQASLPTVQTGTKTRTESTYKRGQSGVQVNPYGHDPNKLMFDGAGQSPIGHRTKYVEAVILGPDYEFLWYQFNCKEYVYDIQARMFRIRISPRSVLAEISKVVCSR
ncbi:MAG: hypothetical protein AB7V46_05425, partial [Thermomicrobiales bacterium]